MEKGSKMLTLGEWPNRVQTTTKLHLSPISKRILAQVHLDFKTILPISYQKYLKLSQQKSKGQRSRQQLEDYAEEIQRRKKQVTILAEIRNSYIQGRDYGRGQRRQSISSNKIRVKSRAMSREYEGQLKLQSGRSFSKKSRNRSQNKSDRVVHFGMGSGVKGPGERHERQEQQPSIVREDSDYFVNFDPRRNSSRKFSGQIEEDSTKSQRKSKTRLIEEHQEYGYFSHSKKNKTRERKDSKRLDASMELCEELVKTVEEWQKMDRDHVQEMSRVVGKLSGRERDRLSKMQSLEKQVVGKRMRVLKSRLKSEGHA